MPRARRPHGAYERPRIAEELNAIGARIPIVFISGHADIPEAIKTIKAGAIDFVQKPYREQHLLDSINDALQRDAAARQVASARDGFAERLATLTGREREVMNQVVKGLSSKSTARALDISYRKWSSSKPHPRQTRRPLGCRADPPHRWAQIPTDTKAEKLSCSVSGGRRASRTTRSRQNGIGARQCPAISISTYRLRSSEILARCTLPAS